ncbi:hypothetical protein GCM10010309_06280 [Streptomyces violaceochromogenes]|nr:hypothetical protein GCM10010309_06280 [Streptomyces violaceochromogenes]
MLGPVAGGPCAGGHSAWWLGVALVGARPGGWEPPCRWVLGPALVSPAPAKPGRRAGPAVVPAGHGIAPSGAAPAAGLGPARAVAAPPLGALTPLRSRGRGRPAARPPGRAVKR